MSISPITSNSSLNQTAQTLPQDFQNLGTALQSGNITTAQQSFAQLLQDKQNVNQTQGTNLTVKIQEMTYSGQGTIGTPSN